MNPKITKNRENLEKILLETRTAAKNGADLIIFPECALTGLPILQSRRSHTEEFYEVTESSFDIVELRAELLDWEQTYNTVRPHQALEYFTPRQSFEQYQQKRREVMCH